MPHTVSGPLRSHLVAEYTVFLKAGIVGPALPCYFIMGLVGAVALVPAKSLQELL